MVTAYSGGIVADGVVVGGCSGLPPSPSGKAPLFRQGAKRVLRLCRPTAIRSASGPSSKVHHQPTYRPTTEQKRIYIPRLSQPTLPSPDSDECTQPSAEKYPRRISPASPDDAATQNACDFSLAAHLAT